MSASELLHLLQMGWYVTYPLGILSVIVFAIAFERLWRFRGIEQGTRDVTRKLVDHLLKRDLAAARALCEASTTPMSAVFAEGLRWGNFAVEGTSKMKGTPCWSTNFFDAFEPSFNVPNRFWRIPSVPEKRDKWI